MATASRRRRSRSPPATDESLPRKLLPTASSSYFPPELIPQIASHVTGLQDFFALRAARRAYRALLPLTAPNLASQAPLLLVPDAATASHALLHINPCRFLRFRLTRTHLTGQTANIHSLGRRIAVDLRDCHQLLLFHVLTGERTPLPGPRSPFSGLLLSGELLFAWKQQNIQYCRLGTPKWRVASIREPYGFHDLIFVNGTLYALVTPGYRLAVVKISDNSDSVELEFLGGEVDAEAIHPMSVFCLAEFLGQLILITAPKQHYRQSPLHVFWWQSGAQEWERITSLGGCTLFLADYRFAGCLGPDHRGIRGDCIYYTIPGLLRVHSLVDDSVTECIVNYPLGKVPMEFCQSVWVFPSMC